MKYLILIYSDEKAWQNLSKEQIDQVMAAYIGYSRELRASGVGLGGHELQPTSTATCVRLRGGKVQTTDGPFAETKEQLGGYYLIEAKDLDEALRWAAKCPGAVHGTLEVRPIIEHPEV